jgi:purine-nucleoside phosphorylase
MNEVNRAKLEQSAQLIKKLTRCSPDTALILGSGLSPAADLVEGLELPFSEIPVLPRPSVAGHRGILKINDRLLILAGRFHYYEGYPMEETVLPVYLCSLLGVKKLIVTNAAGAVNRNLHPGNLALITDHINFMGTNPLIGKNADEFGPRFPDMSEAYDREFRKAALETAGAQGLDLKEGVYAAMSGPSYETPAEIRMLSLLGADMVGMSTVPEVIAARHCGIRVAGISCITNYAAGISKEPLDHTEVIETGKKAAASFSRLVLELLERL